MTAQRWLVMANSSIAGVLGLVSMTPRRWLLTANSTIAGVLGLASIWLVGGHPNVAPKDMATWVLLYVLPAVLAAAVATWKVGWRGLERPTQSPGGALMLSVWTTLMAFGIYFLAVALLLMLWALLIDQPSGTPMMEALGSVLLFAGLVLGYATVLGLLPAMALCWWTSALAMRQRHVELAAGE